MKLYICNAFSLSMLDRESQHEALKSRAPTDFFSARVPRPVTLAEAKEYISFADEVVPAVGHADTAEVIANLLGLKAEQVLDRKTVKLPPKGREPAEFALVGQYVGPRLPEGTTRLPEGATIEFWVV